MRTEDAKFTALRELAEEFAGLVLDISSKFKAPRHLYPVPEKFRDTGLSVGAEISRFGGVCAEPGPERFLQRALYSLRETVYWFDLLYDAKLITAVAEDAFGNLTDDLECRLREYITEITELKNDDNDIR